MMFRGTKGEAYSLSIGEVLYIRPMIDITNMVSSIAITEPKGIAGLLPQRPPPGQTQ